MVKHSGILRFILFALLFLVGWKVADKVIFPKEESPTALETALRAAGDNRKELEKVLRHYREHPEDSLKYKAACFLIENMTLYAYPVAKQLENYKSYYAWLKTDPAKSPEDIADSVKNVFGPLGVVQKKSDINEVDSAYLCHNIEWAFKVWREQPWGKNVPFDMFCEYILPYRIDDEPRVEWRERYYEKYNHLLDAFRMSDALDVEDPIVAANYLIRKLPDTSFRFTSTVPVSFGHVGPDHVEYMTGTCREVTDFAVYLFRALGIPCTVDWVIQREGNNASHYWLVAWDKTGEDYVTDFPFPLERGRKNWWFVWDISGKVYRHTYSINREMYKAMAAFGERVYAFGRLPMCKDVTLFYGKSYKKELKIPSTHIYKEKRKGKIAYLCQSSRERWVPVDWTEYDPGNLVFRNIKKGGVMRAATYEGGNLCFVTDPFYVDRQTNEIHYYSAGEEKQDVVLYAKCNINTEDFFRNRMIGGVFEASNCADFAEKDTLFVIQQRPDRLNTTVRSWSKKQYRYFRYVGPRGAHCNIAELALYQPNDTAALRGQVIGTPGCFQRDGSHEYPNVFDGKSWTSFDYIEPDGGWVGLDVGRAVEVERIVYTPRNRDNYIRRGDMFELFYCDGDWKSVGLVRATSDSLVYRNVPKNVLLFLRNHTRGVDERIFTYEKGSQQWK